MEQTISHRTTKILFGVRQESRIRRTGLITLILAILFTLSTYVLQATLNYPAILTAQASFALPLFAQGGIAVLLAFVGLLLCGVLLLVISLGLAQHLPSRARMTLLVTAGATGAIWVLSALGWLVLVPIWSAGGAVQNYQIFGPFILIFYGILVPLLLVIWTLLLVRLFRAYRVLGSVSAVGLLLVLLRSLIWEMNVILPIETGYYATAGLLAILAMLGESLWLVWLFLFGFYLMRRSDKTAIAVPMLHVESADSKEEGEENV